MHKIKLKLFLLLIPMFFTTSLLIAEQHANVVTQTIEGFENPGDWIVKFSALRCDKWQKPVSMPTNQATTASPQAANNGQTSQNPQASPSPTPSATQNTTDTSSNGYTASTDWIKWINSDNYSPDQKRNIVPAYGMLDADKATQKTILGVKGCWSRPGYNWLAIEPKNPLYTPKDPVSLSIWVWGANYYYDLYVVVKNSEGFYFSLYLGSLNYYGWRNLRVNLPSYVFPRNVHAVDNRLQIVRLKVVGTPNEDADGFYTYFDYMQIGRNVDTGPLGDDALQKSQW